LVELTRALVVLKVADQPGELADFSETEVQELRSVTAKVAIEEVQRVLENLIRTEADLATSHFPRFTVEMVLVRLATMPPAIDIVTLIDRLERLERRLAGGLPAPPPARAAGLPSEPPPPEPETTTAQIAEGQIGKKSEALPVETASEKNWAGLVAFVEGKRRPRISSLLDQSSLLLLELPRLRIGVPRKFYFLADTEMRQDIQDIASAYFGSPVKVEVEKVDNGDKAPPSLHEERIQKESDRQKKLRENAVEHPMIKSALNIFDGKIESIKPIDKGFV
jgi:DNA polymerase-3 subunit gamma/tau